MPISEQNKMDFGGMTIIAKDVQLGYDNPNSTRLPLSSWVVADVVGQQAALTGSTAETTIATLTVPGGLMGPRGTARVTLGWSMSSSANNKTLRIRFTNLSGGLVSGTTFSAVEGYVEEKGFRNTGTTNSQENLLGTGAGLGFGTSSSALLTSTIDTEQDFNLVLTGQLANAGDSITLEFAFVEILPLENN